MYKLLLDRFEKYASQFPGMFLPCHRTNAVAFEEKTIVNYIFPRSMKIDEVEEALCSSALVRQLFCLRPSLSVEFGQRASFYSQPKTALMFKADVRTNDRRLCDTIRVTLYSSIEQMRYEVMSAYEDASKSGISFWGRGIRDIQLDFL